MKTAIKIDIKKRKIKKERERERENGGAYVEAKMGQRGQGLFVAVHFLLELHIHGLNAL
jgi:hypothetical protein